MEKLGEDDALARLRAGDPEVLGELFEIHRERLQHIVRLRMDVRLASRVDVEDVMQEVYLDAASRIHHYIEEQYDGSFFVWLRLVMQQTMANLYRRHVNAKMRDVRRDVSINQGQPLDAGSRQVALQLIGHLTSPSNVAMRTESIDELREAMDRLKPMDREAITLRHFEMLDNKEVAEVLGINEKAASIRYIRAIRRLKEAMVPADQAEEESS